MYSLKTLVCVLPLLRASLAFSVLPPSQHGRSVVVQQSMSSSSPEDDNGDDFDFMASLQSRLEEVNDRETKLPLVVLISPLPRQVINIQVNDNPLFLDLVKSRIEEETPWFGMLGSARSETGQKVKMKNGVKVEIEFTSVDQKEKALLVRLRGTERFRVDGEIQNTPQGWTEARVSFLDSSQQEASEESEGQDRMSLVRAMLKARLFEDLVEEWIDLARDNERGHGQIDQLLVDLEEMPPQEEPSERALWVGALVNPIPAMGVALEIRPALLSATTAEQRVDIALEAIERSIQHMDGTEKLFE